MLLLGYIKAIYFHAVCAASAYTFIDWYKDLTLYIPINAE
jgi:hypothetical protein